MITKKYLEENSLGKWNPELSKQWHPSKNVSLTPFDVTRRSPTPVWWLCPVCKHEWQERSSNRNNTDNTIKNGCPCCSGTVVTKKNCLANIRPELIKRWHPTKNGDLTPYKVSYGSETEVWWQCEANPKHEWHAPVNCVNNCRYCSGRIPSEETSIAVTHPDIAKDWHPTKNGDLTPYNVTKGTTKDIHWLCSVCGHEWTRNVNNRIKSNCPKCSRKSTSFAQESIFYYVSKVFSDVRNRYKLEETEIDVYIADYNIAIEYDSTLHNKEIAIERDKKKNKFLKEKNVPFIRIRDEGCVDLKDNTFYLIERKKTLNEKTLSDAIIELFNLIKKEFSDILDKNIVLKINKLIKDIDASRDRTKIMEQYIFNKKEQSFAKTHPHLLKEWDYEKNGKLSPEQFSNGSNERVHWKCEKGHSWKAPINRRANQNSQCKYCHGANANELDNLAVNNPEVAKWWHPNKNEGKTPYDYKSKSPKKVWWKCIHCGEDFERVIKSQTTYITKCTVCKSTEIE